MASSVITRCQTSNPNIVYDVELNEVSYNSGTNTSNVRFTLKAYSINPGSTFDVPTVLDYGAVAYLYFWDDDDGEYVDQGDESHVQGTKPIYYNSNTVLYDYTFTIQHNDDGKKTLWAKCGFSLFDNGSKVLASVPEYTEFSLELTDLQDTPTITAELIEAGSDYLNVNVIANESCDKWWYLLKLDGHDWTEFQSGTGTLHAGHVIRGLEQNTTYTLYFSAQRAGTTVYGISNFYKFTTIRARYRTVTKIVLYEANETEFTTNGIGVISDAVSCYVTEERNGAFELEMKYPVSGRLFSDIMLRRIIFAKPNKYDYPQPFRIYSISKPIKGQITVKAEHISYDLSGYTVSPFTATSAAIALTTMVNSQDVRSPFYFSTDLDVEADLTIDVPTNIRTILGGGDNSILAKYGGELVFDEFEVKLLQARGEDRGVTIRYGKNLIDLTQEENCNNVYTAVRPYYRKKDKDGVTYVELEGKIVEVPGLDYPFTRILPIDFTSYFDSDDGTPSESDLEQLALQYIAVYNVGIPEVSLTVSFQDLSDIYNDTNSSFEEVRLCDMVTVIFEKLNVNATAECVKTKFDVLKGRYDSIEIGVMKSNLANTISGQSSAINGNATKTQLDTAISDASKLLSNDAVARYGVYTNYDEGNISYICVGRLYVIGRYANTPIKMELYRRGEYSSINMYLLFSNVNSTSPTVQLFKYDDPSGATNLDAFIYNVADNKWDIYIKKDNEYDAMSVMYNIPYHMRDKVVLQSMEQKITTKPGSATTASTF